MTESPKAFGLLDLTNMPTPVEQKPSKGVGQGKGAAGGKKDNKPGQKGGGAADKKAMGSAGYDARAKQSNGGSRQANAWPKWRLNTAEEEAKRKRMEFDGYKAEARIRSTAGNHDKAIEMYTKALEIEPKDRPCLVARATCHFQIGNFEQAVMDADKAIALDHKCAKAIHVKGEALYQKGDFEMALVCYFRAKKIRPGVPEYDRGIQKAQGAIENCIGELSNTKLVHTGDLNYFESQNKRDEKSTELIIHRGSRTPSSAVYSQAATSHRASEKKPSRVTSKKKAKTVKQMLGELFGDWQYLENILADEEDILCNMKEEEVNEEQKRRRLLREKRDALKTNNPAADDDDDKLIPRDTFTADVKKRKQELSENVRDMCRKELQYLDERSEFWRQQKSPQNARKASGKDGEAGRDSSASSTTSSNFTSGILNTLEEIEEDQAEGKHFDSLLKAELTLRKIQHHPDEDLHKKQELLATVYSLIGNAHFEMDKYEEALENYKMDLEVAEEHKLEEAKSRALDNLGRTHARQGNYEEAINVFEQKVPMVQGPLEATWLYHEMGRCYLEVESYEKARDCGKKSMESCAFDKAWQLNASVLIAQAEGELGNYETSLDAFESALQIANENEDEEAKDAIDKAIEEMNEKMSKGDTDKGKKDNTNKATSHNKDGVKKSDPASATSRTSKRRSISTSSARSVSAKST